jgi:hypothetical protein
MKSYNVTWRLAHGYNEPLLTLQEIADKLNVEYRTIRHMLNPQTKYANKPAPIMKHNGNWSRSARSYYRKSDFIKFLKENGFERS